MELGYRIIRPDDVGKFSLKLAQISLWRTANWDVAEGEEAVLQAIAIAQACKMRGIRTVFHPLEYPLTNAAAPQTLDVMQRLATASDLGIIVHDEGNPAPWHPPAPAGGGKRLPAHEDARISSSGRSRYSGEPPAPAGGGSTADRMRLTAVEAGTYERNVKEISRLCHLSIENSYNSGDITWFWERFVVPFPPNVSITLDIGHLELAGLDSVSFVRDMPQRLIDRMQFVHMHHHDGNDTHWVKDHKPLVPGCREIEALKVLLARKSDIRVILELDAAEDGMAQSIELLRNAGFGMWNEK